MYMAKNFVLCCFVADSWVQVGVMNRGEVCGMTMTEKLNQILKDGQWHSTAELVEQVGHRFSATLHRAVKEQGWQVEKRRVDLKMFEYRLIKVESLVKH